jgi:hypothetical protein
MVSSGLVNMREQLVLLVTASEVEELSVCTAKAAR